MIKNLLLATFTTLVICSCSDDKVTSVSDYSNKVIEFTTLIDKTESRASITDPSNILGFTITGWWEEGQQYLFNAFDITRGESSKNMWEYSPPRYWPSVGYVSFYAYSPASSCNVTRGLYDWNPYSDLDPKITYSVPTTNQFVHTTNEYQSQEDFLVAVTKEMNATNSGAHVTLNFQHALSRVLFQAKKPNDYITYIIYDIELVNVYNRGTLTLRRPTTYYISDGIPEAGGFGYGTAGDNPLTLWESDYSSSKTTMAVDMSNSPVYILSDEYTSVIGETNALMVMPQVTVLGSIYVEGSYQTTFENLYTPINPSFDADGEFYVKVGYKAFQGEGDYRVYYAGSNTNHKYIYLPVEDPLRTGEPFAFEIGRQYTFNLTFGHEISTPIGFDVQVQEWTMRDIQL